MMLSTLSSVFIVALAVSVPLAEGQSGPHPGWKDSYSIGGKCYCETTFDHNIGGLNVPGAGMTVREACAAAGSGPMTIGSEKRLYYNDVQCGNGPANDAGDEDWCPGRVDMGENNKEGCMIKGPKFSFNNPEPAPEPTPPPAEQSPPLARREESTFMEEEEPAAPGAVLTGLSVIDVDSGATKPLGENPAIQKSDYPSGFSILADVSDPGSIEKVVFTDSSGYSHKEMHATYDMFSHRAWPNPPTGSVIITVVATMKDGKSETLEATVELM